MSLLYKDDWEEAKERYEAWWAGENAGRCGMWVNAPRAKPFDALAADYARSAIPDGMPSKAREWQTIGIVSVRGLRENPLAGDPARIIQLD